MSGSRPSHPSLHVLDVMRPERAPGCGLGSVAVADLPRIELPTATARPERADAVRNRERILCAAKQLFDEKGVENVSMDDIAACAGVGKGTLYRRFGDRSGLAVALLDAREAQFQEELLRGAPPLGPGAPPRERLRAFLCALAGHLDEHLALHADSEASGPAGRFHRGPYPAWHQHCALLLRQIDPSLDAEVLAHQLLAPLAANLWSYLRFEQGVAPERITASLCAMVDAVTG